VPFSRTKRWLLGGFAGVALPIASGLALLAFWAGLDTWRDRPCHPPSLTETLVLRAFEVAARDAFDLKPTSVTLYDFVPQSDRDPKWGFMGIVDIKVGGGNLSYKMEGDGCEVSFENQDQKQYADIELPALRLRKTRR
jgi:hypothetical protein